MSKKKDKGREPRAVAGSASIPDPPALRVSIRDQDEIEKRADSYTASPVAQAQATSEPNESEQEAENLDS